MINKGMLKKIMVDIHVIEYFIFKEEGNLVFFRKVHEIRGSQIRRIEIIALYLLSYFVLRYYISTQNHICIYHMKEEVNF